MGDAFVGEQLAAAALGAEAEVTGIRAVHRDSQPQREIAFQLGRVVGDQVRPIGVGDQGPQPLHQPGAAEQLQRQGLGPTIEHGEGDEALSGVARDDSGEQVEVVVDHAGEDRLRSDIDQPGPGLAEQQQQEEVALLVGLHRDCGALGGIEGHRRDDHDRLRILVHHLDRLPQRDQLLLKHLEARLGVRG